MLKKPYNVLCNKYKEEGYVQRDHVQRDFVVKQTTVEKIDTVEIKRFFGGRRLVIRR